MSIDLNITVGQLVAERPARSRIFQSLGIDFCCGGKKPLAEACAAKGLDAPTVAKMIEAAEAIAGPSGVTVSGPVVDANAMTLTALCDHIENTHHAYIKAELPRLGMMWAKIAGKHGDHHPWAVEVRDVFMGLFEEMTSHMHKEERILFPAIRAIERGQSGGTCFGSVANPIRVMEAEHDGAGDALARMRDLSANYTPPQGACPTFRAALDGLAQLEADMHQHVHKENNVLFPKAIEIERQVLTAAR
jgi:regulator of cell morphogenesis and NO signaling